MAESDEELEAQDEGDRPGRAGTAGGFAAGLLIGALLGAGIALLYAPDRGSRTRQDLRRRLRRLQEEAGEGIEQARGQARRELRRRRRQLKEGVDRARERFE